MSASTALRLLAAGVVSGLTALALTAPGSDAAGRGLPGRIVFAHGGSGSYYTSLYLANRDGSGVVRLTRGAADSSPSWSPSGTRIAFERRSPDADIFVIAPDATRLSQLTFSNTDDADPSWSGRGDTIVFESNRTADNEIWAMSWDGTKQRRLTRRETTRYSGGTAHATRSTAGPVATPRATTGARTAWSRSSAPGPSGSRS